MKKLFFLVAAIGIQTVAMAQTTWKNDKAHSRVAFTVSHLGISDVTGLFKDFDATIKSSKPDFSDAVFELTVQTASVNTEMEMRDKDLRSDHFFESDKFPTMTFKSTSIKKVSENHYKLSGDLTLHGITKPVTLNLLVRGKAENTMMKDTYAGFQITGVIKRSEFKFGAYPPPTIGDEVTIKADGEFSIAK
jgi:polyisoprenoid-binding protein YceI